MRCCTHAKTFLGFLLLIAGVACGTVNKGQGGRGTVGQKTPLVRLEPPMRAVVGEPWTVGVKVLNTTDRSLEANDLIFGTLMLDGKEYEDFAFITLNGNIVADPGEEEDYDIDLWILVEEPGVHRVQVRVAGVLSDEIRFVVSPSSP